MKRCGPFGLVSRDNLPSLVGRSVVDDDHFVARPKPLPPQVGETIVEMRRPVIRGDDDTHARFAHDAVSAARCRPTGDAASRRPRRDVT
jgi:hypothetical protein